MHRTWNLKKQLKLEIKLKNLLVTREKEKFMEHWSIEDYKNFENKKIRKTKYRANKTSVDGHTFDSQKECLF